MRRYIVVGVLLLGFALRVSGIDFARPDAAYNADVYPQVNPQIPVHPDEYFYVSIPLEMHIEERINPNFFENPTFLINLNYVTYALTGTPIPPDNPSLNQRQYAPFPLYVIGRLYSALGGLLAVAAGFALAKRLYGFTAGVSAALLIAWSLPLVQHAHYATTSSLAAGFVMVALWGSICAVQTGQYRMLWVAGAAAGLALGNRYNVAPVGFVLALAGIIVWWRNRTPKTLFAVIAAGVLSIGIFFFTSPFILLDFDQFWQQFSYIYTAYKTDAAPVEMPLWLAYRYIVLMGLGGIAFLFSIWGGYRLVRRMPDVIALLLVFIVPYTVVVLDNNRIYTSDQLTLPVIAMLAVMAGVGIAAAGRWYPPAGGLALVASLVLPTILTGQLLHRFIVPDTRYVAQEWVYDHIPRQADVLLVGSYNVPLDASDYRVRQEFVPADVTPADINGASYIIVSDALLFEQGRRTASGQGWYNDTVASYFDAHDFGEPLHTVQRRPALLDHLLVNNVPYWHHPALYIFCVTDAACAVVE